MNKITTKEPSIGIGLDALFGVNSTQNKQLNPLQIKLIPIAHLIASPLQPRRHFSPIELQELAESIQSQGILQPLIVRENQDKYEIIAGERRWRAAKLVGLNEVPCIVKNVDNNAVLAYTIIENIQRENLNIVEEAQAFAKLYQQLNLTHEEVAKHVGKSRSHITNLLRILTLPQSILMHVESKQLSMGHVRTLLTLEPAQQQQVTEQIIKQQLSVRDTEKLVTTIKNVNSHIENNKPKQYYSKTYNHWSQDISNLLSTKVSVNVNEVGKGRVIIEVDSHDKLQWVMRHLVVE